MIFELIIMLAVITLTFFLGGVAVITAIDWTKRLYRTVRYWL